MRGFNWGKHPEITARILEVYKGRLSRETADIIEQEFGIRFNDRQIYNFLKNRGLSSGLGRSKKGVRYFWNHDYEAFVKERIDEPYSQIIEEFKERFGVELTESQLGHFKWRHGIYSTNDGRYKEGVLPKNHSELGAESRKGGKYIWVKTSEKRWTGNDSRKNWVQKQRHIWEQMHGPIPEGMLVTFRDGDTENMSPDNLMLVSKTENCFLTAERVRHMSPEVRPTGELVAKLKASILERRKNELK